MKKIAVLLLTLLLSCPSLALADYELSLGLGVSADVMAYKDYDTQWSPRPIISLEAEHFYVRGYDAGVYLLKIDPFRLSAFVSYNDFDFSPSESSNSKVRRLKKRYSTLLGGLNADLLTPIGFFEASGTWEMLGLNSGFDCYFTWYVMFEAGPLKVIPAVGLNWQSSRYIDYYYGVSRNEAARSGLEAYDAGSGLTPYIDLSFDYSLSEKWDLLLLLEYEFLSKAVKDSPMVDKDYSLGITFGVMYGF